MGLHVNQPYFFVIAVPYNSLLRADHIDRSKSRIFAFHDLLKLGFSMVISVKKNHAPLSKIPIVLLSLLHDQEYESIVESSKRIVNFCKILSKADGNGLLMKH